MSEANPQVLIVGAGPTGLLLAAELERRDVSCLLIDALDAPRGWDRATIVHPRSMEIFEALGLADGFLDTGVPIREAWLRSDGELLAVMKFDMAGGRYTFDLGLSEEVTESVLTGYLEEHGGSVRRSTSLVGLVPGEDGVTATLESDGERREVSASWVVGCDGLHSLVREAAGIDFQGTDIQAQWAVFDATIDGWTKDYQMQVAHLDMPPVVLTPLPGRRWRVYMRPESETSDLPAEAVEVLRRYEPGVTFADVENPTRFRCHSRVAERFRSGRVLLAGDAAHACTPAEGHGMNTGLQDAFNLGWKLALVCRGEAGEGLLDSYELERRPVAQRVVASGEAAEAGHAMTDPAERAARNEEIRRVFSDPETAHHEAAAFAETDRAYARSRAVGGEDGTKVAPGHRLPETPPADPGDGLDPRPLHELAHRRGPTLLVLGGPEADPLRVGELVTQLEGHAGSPALDAVVGFSTRPDGQPLGRIDETLAEQLGIREVTVLVVRPDRYLGFRDDDGDPRAVEAYLEALVA